MAVASPGRGGETKRDTSRRLPSAGIDRCLGFAPTAMLAVIVPFDGSSRATRPIASSTTQGAPSAGENTMPKGRDARGRTMVRATRRVAVSTMLTLSEPRLLTQSLPSWSSASARGLRPTGISAMRPSEVASMTLTESLSWFATQTRLPAARFS